MRKTLLPITLVLTAVVEVEGSGVSFLLASTSADTADSCSGVTCGSPPTDIRFYLAWTDNVGGWAAFAEDQTPWWSLEDGQTGSYVFTPANTSSFDGFVTHLTDGVDGFLGRGYTFQSGGSGMGYSSESSAFGTDTDLIGYEIDSIRLFVDELSVSSHDTGYDFSADVTWEFWGVPEPATLSLLVLGGLLVTSRRRFR